MWGTTTALSQSSSPGLVSGSSSNTSRPTLQEPSAHQLTGCQHLNMSQTQDDAIVAAQMEWHNMSTHLPYQTASRYVA